MITIPETRTLTLYLVDSDGQPVRAATDHDLATIGCRMHSTRLERLRHRVDSLKAAVRKVAGERDAWAAQCNMASEAQADALNRIADLESRAERAKSLAPLVDHWRARAEALESERDELKVDRDALAALHADLGEQVDSAWKALGNPPVRGLTTLADVIQVRSEDLNERIAEFESRPIHPALVRLAEAATVYLRSDATTMSADLNSLSSAVDALPSPLPTVVTCGECVHLEGSVCKEHDSFVRAAGYCHLGKRREG